MAPVKEKVKKKELSPKKTSGKEDIEEKKITPLPGIHNDLMGKTPEQLIQELQTHQVELQTQADELRRIQHELEKSRYQYIDLYEFAPVGYLSLNEKTLITRANLTAATILGIERNKLINHGFGVFVEPGYLAKWDLYFLSVFRQEGKQVMNLTIRRGDGTTFPVRMEGIRPAGSAIVQMTITDISDIEKVQEALRTSHSRLESVMEAGNLAWWEMECSTGKVSFNERKARMLGYPAEQFSHYSDFTTLLHPIDYEPTMQAMRDLLSGLKKNYEADYRVRTRTGEYRWFHDVGGISAYDPEGVPLRVVGLVMDITRKKEAEEALRNSEIQYRSVIDNASEGIVVAQDGVLTFANPEALEMIQSTPEKILNMPFVSFIHPDDRALVAERYQRRLLGEDIPSQYDFRVLGEEGRITWVQISAVITTWKGKPATLNFLTDITGRKQAEEKLQLANTILSTQADTSIDGILVVDDSGSIISFNRRFIEIWGIPAEMVSSRSDIQVLQFVIDKLVDPGEFQTKKQYLYDHRLETSRDEITLRDGRVLDRYTAPMIGSSGEYLGRVWNFRDITEQKRSEKALNDAVDWLKMVQRNANAGFWDWDFPTGKLTWSEEFFDLFGLPQSAEPSFDTWLAVLHPEDRTPALEKIERSVKDKKDLWNEYRIILQNGEQRWIGVSGRTTYDETGLALRMSGICLDISERKRLDAALAESEQRYRGLIEGVPDYILVHRNGKILFVNPAVKNIIGDEGEELVGSDITNFIAPESRALVAAMVVKRAANEAIPPYEITIIPKGGMKRVTEVHGSLIMYQGEPASLNILSDITDRKRAEEMRERLFNDLTQKNAELERFTYTVSHDLKSPLITIKGFLGYLEKDAKDGDTERLHQDIARIHSATSKMEEFIAALLELSRVGRIVNPPVEVPLSLLVEEAVEVLDSHIRERGVSIIIPGDLPEVYGDRVRLQQVMTNLIGNAIKFMGDQEKPRIEISAFHSDGNVIICVKDNGIGIAPEHLDTIFSVFTRLNPTVPGAGIGLALVKRIVEVQGGTCSVESPGLGKGSRFCFSLPCMPREGESGQEKKKGPLPLSPDGV